MDAVHGADEVAAAHAYAFKGRGAQLGEAVGLLAEVLVLLLVVELVVALHRGLKVLHRQTELFRQLLDGVGLHHQTLVAVHGHKHALVERQRPDGLGPVLMVEHPAAAVAVEALHIRDIVGVPDHGVGHAGQSIGGVQDVVIAAGLVGEALAVQAHLQEGLRAHPEQRAGRLASNLIRGNGAAIKEHAAVGLVHYSAGPEAGLDAVALAAGIGVIDVDHLYRLGLQGLQHVHVQAVAAGADDDALGGVIAYDALLSLGIDAGHGLVLFDEAEQGGVVVNLQTQVLAVFLQNVGGGSVGALGVAHLEGVTHIIDGVAYFLTVAVHFVAEAEPTLGHPVGVPVDGLAGVVGPDLVQALVAVAVGLAIELCDDVELVRVVPVLQLLPAADRTQGVADTGAAEFFVHLLNEDRLGALFHRRAGGEETGRTGADDQDLGLDGLHHFGLVDGRSLAQPIHRGGLLGGSTGLQQAHVHALGLGHAALQRLTYGAGGVAGAGNGVDLKALTLHDLLGQFLGGGLADGFGLTRSVDRRLQDAGLVHREGDGHVSAEAGRGGRIGAGGVDGG